jgi:hypothetical protein
MSQAVSTLRLKEPRSVRAEVLGTRWSVRLNDYRAELCLPQLVAGVGGQREYFLDAPKVHGARELQQRDEDLFGGWDWGLPYTWNPKKGRSSVLSTLESMLLRTPFPREASDAERLRLMEDVVQPSAETWVARLAQWLDLRACLHLEPTVATKMQAYTHDEYASRFWLHDKDGAWVRLKPSVNAVISIISPIGGGQDEACTVDDWEQSVRAANRRTPVPDHWRLMESAFSSSTGGSQRVAVLDAATAVEVVLADLIRKQLGGAKQVQAEAALNRFHGIEDKRQFLSDCGVPVSRKVQNDLARVRNQVIHGNKQPSRDETKAALNIARKVLTENAPLPRL